MTRTERTIIQHWRGIATACAIVFLFGVSWATWHRVDASDRKYADAVAEADLRGNAVSTLAGDVRALRQQVKAAGKTPVAPDPTRAVPSLSARAEVPVPIPGPPGAAGPSGKAAPTITPSPGPSGQTGATGQPGSDSTVPGPQGEKGEPGADSTVPGPQGAKGDKGDTGPPPDGWTYTDGTGTTYDCTPDSDNPKHYTCRATSTPGPSPTPTSGGLGLAAVASTATYRRLR